MSLTPTDVVEGRTALIIILALLSFALLANVFVKPPGAAIPALIALGGLLAMALQNTLIYVSSLTSSDDEEEEEDADGAEPA